MKYTGCPVDAAIFSSIHSSGVSPMSTLRNHVQELRWRGLLHDSMPGTEEFLLKGPASGYIGFDPTADSLHVGNMVQIMMLKHFQDSGHRPIALVGGATGMVGDPSGKSSERNLLDEEALRHNQECVGKQLARFIDFDSKTLHTLPCVLPQPLQCSAPYSLTAKLGGNKNLP